MRQHYNLGFISDEDIYNHVRATVSTYRRSINLEEFNKNIIDPIKLTFDAKIYDKSFREMIESECIRQIDKTNSNSIGYFHQNIFKYAEDRGWTVPENGETGFDVENVKTHIFCEVKNKHNTMNSASAQSTYIKMQNKILFDDKATCYLVEIISKRSQDRAWQISLSGKSFSHDHIRRISVDKFYDLVFGYPNAFFKLCKALPTILTDVLAEESDLKIQNSVFSELSRTSKDLYKSLYLLAFRTYEGFDSF